MQFEVGKFYRTRDGHKLKFIYDKRNDFCVMRRPLVFAYVDEDINDVYIISLTSDGKQLNDWDDHSFDIIGEWHEPIRKFIDMATGKEYFLGELSLHDLDKVSEEKEQPIKGWINIYKNLESNTLIESPTYSTKKECDDAYERRKLMFPIVERIGCLKVIGIKE